MFKNTFQSGFLSILYSIGSKPLQIWDKKVRNGHIKRITDNDIQSFVLEILGTNVSTTFITCPADPRKTLGIRLPYLIMIVKNMKKYFTFEVQILDDKNVRRRFRASNFQSTTRVKPFICTMPMRLDEGWNQIQFNLSDFTRRAYGTNYVETLRVQVHEQSVHSGCAQGSAFLPVEGAPQVPFFSSSLFAQHAPFSSWNLCPLPVFFCFRFTARGMAHAQEVLTPLPSCFCMICENLCRYLQGLIVVMDQILRTSDS
ncbi:unnamed protein product, partial [Ixodes pacificus]